MSRTAKCRAAVAGVALAVVLPACGGDAGGGAEAGPETTGAGDGRAVTSSSQAPTTATSPGATAAPADGAALGQAETVVGGLEVPWGVAFVDGDTLLVTERPGRVRLVAGGQLRAEPLATIPAVDQGEGGLLGIALHPQFPQERYAYLYYTASGENRVVRHPVGEDLSFGPEEVVVDGIPSAGFHNGGRIAFGPDGMLYVATGDATEPQAAADPSSLAGKILRVRPDGSNPPGNPYGDSPVWSYGHRNPQGLAWDRDGNLYASEHGPTGDVAGLCCHDEVNLIEPGGFYGWPYRAGEVPAADGDAPAEPIAPIAASGQDTWAPAGVAVLQDEATTHLVVANLAAQQLLRFVLAPGDPRAVERTEVALDGFGRLRAAAVGPDGCLYLTTSNTDGRGQPASDDDRLLRSCLSAGGSA